MPRALRIVLMLLFAAAVLYVQFTWVFPWIESKFEDPTLESRAQLRQATAPR